MKTKTNRRRRIATAPPVIALALLALSVVPILADAFDDDLALGLKAYEKGRYAKAEKLLLSAVEQTAAFAEDDRRVAIALAGLADVYVEQSRYGEAESFYARAIAAAEKLSDPQSAVDSRFGLAMCYLAQEKGAAALPLLEQVLSTYEAASVPQADLAEIILTLLIEYAKLGETSKIEVLFERYPEIKDGAAPIISRFTPTAKEHREN